MNEPLVDPQPDEIELPPVDDVTQPWWDATRERRLLVQRCNACGSHQHYPRALCAVRGSTGCGGTDLGWVEAAGTGTVDSFTVVHRGLPGFAAPYVVARVRLDLPGGERGVVLLTNLVDVDLSLAEGDDPADLDARIRCDDAVSLRWRPLSDGRHLPVFGLDPRGGAA